MAERQPTVTVGREPSLRVLRRAVTRAAEHSPSVLLVGGETGVGKTHLLRALATSEDLTLLSGSCVPVAGDPLPFAPLIQALRRLGSDGVLRSQLDRSPDLARLVPSLARRTEAGSDAADTRAGRPAEPSQLGLFQAVLALIERLGAVRPVLYIVEDVHWADRSTLDLVRFLATNLTDERVLLVVTYRDDAVLAGTSLALWLAELGRLEVTERLRLDRLGEEETAALVEHLAVGAVSAEVVQATVRRSAGNPLFVEHLLLQDAEASTGSRDRGPLPATLHELIGSRVAALPEGTRVVLRSGAVLGRPAPVSLLAATMGRPVEEAEQLLRPAVDQHVLEVRQSGSIAFRHPAFGEVVYAGLLPSERARLHRAAAEALEAHGTPDAGSIGVETQDTLAGELARHWLSAGDRHRALDAAVEAAEAADRMYAFADAHVNYARAAELMQGVESDHDRVALLTHAARAASFVGDYDDAVRLAEAALEGVDEPTRRASLASLIGSIQYIAGRGSEAERWFRQVLDGLPNEVSVVTARAHAGLAMVAASWSRLEDADRHSAEGLAMARAVGARREEGVVHNAMGGAASLRGNADEAVEHLRESLAIAIEVNVPSDQAAAYINLSHVLLSAERLDELVAVCAEGTAALTRVGLLRQIGSILRANAAEGLVGAGRLDEADQIIQETMAHHPRGITAAPILEQAGRLALIRGDLPTAREYCEQVRDICESENAPYAWLRVDTEGLAEVELWDGRPEVAYDLVLDCLERIAGSDEEAFGGTLVGLGVRSLADQADARRDPASRRRLEELRTPIEEARKVVQDAGRLDPATDAWHAAESTRIDLASDPEAWARTATLWHEARRPFPAAYARWREAEARLDRSEGSVATMAVRAAHLAATEMGAVRLAEEVERLAGWHRVDLVAPVQEADQSALDAYGLTSRELEVLTFLSQGRTNQEIADELWISVKTASVHVSNILRKLDVSGRQEAARVAHRLGVG